MTLTSFRCPNGSLFGVLVNELLEVRCRNRRCGYSPGIVVLHYFDPRTGQCVNTKKYRDPRRD